MKKLQKYLNTKKSALTSHEVRKMSASYQYENDRNQTIEIGDIIEFVDENISSLPEGIGYMADKRFVLAYIDSLKYLDDSIKSDNYTSSDEDDTYPDEANAEIFEPGTSDQRFEISTDPYIVESPNFGGYVTYYAVENKYFATIFNYPGSKFSSETEVIFYRRPKIRNREFYDPGEKRKTNLFLKNYIEEWYSTLHPDEIKYIRKKGINHMMVTPENWDTLINDDLVNEYVDIVESWDDRIDYIQDEADLMFYDINFDVDSPYNRKIIYLLSYLNGIYGSPFLSLGINDEVIEGFKASRHFANEYLKVKEGYMSLLQPSVKAARS